MESIEYGYEESPFGRCLICTQKGAVVHLSFGSTLEEAKMNFPETPFIEKSQSSLIEAIFCSGVTPSLLLKGTAFQLEVWSCLMQIPRGTTWSYEEVAQCIGKKSAVRAAASAVARNPIAYLIPCHRVIRKSGALGQYRWGTPLKKRLLEHESTS